MRHKIAMTELSVNIVNELNNIDIWLTGVNIIIFISYVVSLCFQYKTVFFQLLNQVLTRKLIFMKLGSKITFSNNSVRTLFFDIE